MINIDRNLFLPPSGNIIAITSGVGSMGKTWLSITLAQALNMMRRSVLLFDANNGLLNTDFQLDVPYEHYLNEVISGKISLNQAVTSVNKKRFDVISGCAGSETLEDIASGRLQILQEDMMLLSRNYNITVMDLSSSEKIMNNLLPPNSDIVLVCTNDPSNLVSTYKFLQRQVSMSGYKSLQIVVNYANSFEEGQRTYNTLRRACEEYIKTTPRLLGIIRRDTRVRDSIRNHAMLLNRYPDSEAAEDVINIAKKLITGENMDEQKL